MALRTKLPEALHTPEAVNEFISELYKNNEFFHLDDDPADIDWGTTDPTPEEVAHLSHLMVQAHEVCKDVKDVEGHNWGVWALPIIDTIMNGISLEVNNPDSWNAK